MNTLRKLRITIAVIFFLAVTLLFLDFTGSVHSYLGWCAQVQFIPALLAAHFGIIITLVILTLIFGRLYCSVICPLGVYQDVASRIGLKFNKKRKIKYLKAFTKLRLGFLVVFIASIISGLASVVALLEPYSIYGRIASNLFQPLYKYGNNLLAYIAERVGSYAFYSSEVLIISGGVFAVAVIFFILISFTAARGGRDYCNMICPVGTTLGYLSKFSLLKIRIDQSKCNGCQKCTKECKARAIETKTRDVDYTRCVVCFDCIDSCKRGAISFGLRRTPAKETDSSKRSMLAIAATLFAHQAVKGEEKLIDGGLAYIEDKKVPVRQTPVLPAGSESSYNFHASCTGCQLCVSVCENNVLRGSSSLKYFMQPEMSFERGYCRPECTKCSEVCPNGAIKVVDIAEKSSTQIGHAQWIEKNCLVVTEGVSCDNCATQCPTGAISLIQPKDDKYNGGKVPMINTAKCIGCGACEYLCPARPFSAIYVEGHSVHKTI